MANLLNSVCIFSAILGITLLIIISDKISIPQSSISSITKTDVNKYIKINGIVKNIIKKGSIIILDLEDKTAKIRVVLFKSENIGIEKGSFIEVEGKVSLYEDQLQILAETIKI